MLTLYILCWRWAATLWYLLCFPDFLNRFFNKHGFYEVYYFSSTALTLAFLYCFG